MPFKDWPLPSLLPHSGDMVLLDEVMHFDDDGLKALARVKPGPHSLADGALPPWLGLELMAQAVGVWAGCRARLAGNPVQLGFLLGTRRYDCFADTFPAGSLLTVSAQRSLIDNSGMAVFECAVHDSDQLLAEARLTIFQPPDVGAFMQENLL